MRADQSGSQRERGKVVDLGAYRKSRGNDVRDLPPIPARVDDTRAHVYVELDAYGKLSYGLRSATHDNALYLLEPTLYLIGQLIRLAIEE